MEEGGGFLGERREGVVEKGVERGVERGGEGGRREGGERRGGEREGRRRVRRRDEKEVWRHLLIVVGLGGRWKEEKKEKEGERE